MNNQIGFYIPVIHNTEVHNAIIRILNKISEKYNTILFNSQYDAIDVEPRRFGVLHCNQSKYFYGMLFGFDINSISIMEAFPAPYKKIFITSDIFWKNKSYPAKMSQDLMMNNIDIVTLNDRAYDLYNICFKAPVFNMNNGLTSEDFLNVIDSLLSTK